MTCPYRACATAKPFPDPFMAAVAKVHCNEMAIRVANDALQMHGGFGFTEEYAVNRLYRGARCGTSETLRDLIGNQIMASNRPDDLFGYDMMGV
jgi:alkylation response protein AidB-like acyl-CoA dehydrogenase